LKRKGQAVEADVISNIKVLIASYVEHNTSQGKSWIFDSNSTVHVCSYKKMFNSLVQRRKGISKWGWLGL